MAFKQRSSGSFKMMGSSSPAKKAGIFEGEGESRVRIGEGEAAEKEAAGATNITRTAADNPDKKEGEQQLKNLGPEYSKFDADLQNRSNRDIYDPNLFLAMGNKEPLLAKGAEKKIQEHENEVGGDPMKTYMINGKEVSFKERNRLMAEHEAKNEEIRKNNRMIEELNSNGTTTSTYVVKQDGPERPVLGPGGQGTAENQKLLAKYYKAKEAYKKSKKNKK